MIYVFDPAGNVVATHPTPVDMPTNCAFAGAGLSVLYVTFGTGYLYRVPDAGMRGHIIYPRSP
jgi:sugar lactone lactonase YvrE